MERLSTLPAIKDLFPEHFIEGENVPFDAHGFPQQPLSSSSSSSATQTHPAYVQQQQQAQQPHTQPHHPHPDLTQPGVSHLFSEDILHHHPHPSKRPRMARGQREQQQQQHTYDFVEDDVHMPYTKMEPHMEAGLGEYALEEGEEDVSAEDAKGRKHVCAHCGKRFNRPSSLKIHEHSHTGAKPFPCPHPTCGRTFSVSSNMRRHFRNHAVQKQSQSQPVHAQLLSNTEPLQSQDKAKRYMQHGEGLERPEQGSREQLLHDSLALHIKPVLAPAPAPNSKYGGGLQQNAYTPTHTVSAPMTPPYTNDGSEFGGAEQDSYRRSDSAAPRVEGRTGSDARLPEAAAPPWEGYGFPAMYAPPASAEYGAEYGYSALHGYAAPPLPPHSTNTLPPPYPVVHTHPAHSQPYEYAPAPAIDPAFADMLNPAIARHEPNGHDVYGAGALPSARYVPHPHPPPPASLPPLPPSRPTNTRSYSYPTVAAPASAAAEALEMQHHYAQLDAQYAAYQTQVHAHIRAPAHHQVQGDAGSGVSASHAQREQQPSPDTPSMRGRQLPLPVAQHPPLPSPLSSATPTHPHLHHESQAHSYHAYYAAASGAPRGHEHQAPSRGGADDGERSAGPLSAASTSSGSMCYPPYAYDAHLAQHATSHERGAPAGSAPPPPPGGVAHMQPYPLYMASAGSPAPAPSPGAKPVPVQTSGKRVVAELDRAEEPPFPSEDATSPEGSDYEEVSRRSHASKGRKRQKAPSGVRKERRRSVRQKA